MSGNSGGENNPSERDKIIKFGRLMLLDKNSELTGLNLCYEI